jgi:hypothetical protein
MVSLLGFTALHLEARFIVLPAIFQRFKMRGSSRINEEVIEFNEIENFTKGNEFLSVT